MPLRDYQQTATDALWTNLDTHCVASLPTGSGKSWIIAELCRRARVWKGRILVLAPSKELVKQDAEKISLLLDEQVGIYCAGLNEKTMRPVTVGTIHSVVNATYGGWDLIVVDEAHLIPHQQCGRYHKVFAQSPDAKIVGLTATPYRLDGGMLHKGKDRLFEKLVCEIKTIDLIKAGWLSPVISYRGAAEANLDGVHTRQGDFVTVEMAERFEDILPDTIEDVIHKSKGRNAALIFCASIRHAEAVHDALCGAEERVAIVTGMTASRNRADILQAFQGGAIRYLVNVDVLTTGFDYPGIDCIALLRATKSPGLYVQMIGRGLRIAEEKRDCILLDYGGNVMRHGPLDDVRIEKTGIKREAKLSKTCRSCSAEIALHYRQCPHCGYEFPIEQREVRHGRRAFDEDPMVAHVVEYAVTGVDYERHQKQGKPDSLKVTYRCGMINRFAEWICIEHEGYPRRKAEQWFAMRGARCPATVSQFLDSDRALFKPEKIYVRHSKYPEIIHQKIKGETK